jgi:hypothetical protein
VLALFAAIHVFTWFAPAKKEAQQKPKSEDTRALNELRKRDELRIFNQLQAKQGKKYFGAAGVALVTNYKSANFTAVHASWCSTIKAARTPMEQKVPGSHRGGQINDGPPKHMDAVDTARDELFEETSGLIYCPRCILEHAPRKEITPSKWVFSLRVDESKLSRKQFKQNSRRRLEGLTRTGRKIGCMLEMSRMAFVPLKQLEDNAHKLEKDCTELVQDIDGEVSESSRTTCSRQV